MPSVYIIEVKRSPIGKTNGALMHIRPEDMLSQLIQNLSTIKNNTVEDVIVASAVGLGGNLARLSALEAGLPMNTTATTIDFQCGGSLKSLEYGYYSIASGAKNLVLVAGVESTSLEAKVFLNPSDPKYHGDVAQKRGQFSPETIGDPDMLEGAENCYALLKAEQSEIDDIVLESHRRAVKTRQSGLLKTVICPLKTEDGRQVLEDESIRDSMSQRLINRAKPLLGQGAYSNAANSCLTHDGASVMVLASKKMVLELGIEPLAEIVGITSIGINPNYSPLGAFVAAQKIIAQHDIEREDIASIEVNEAFAIKTWSIINLLGMMHKRVNPLGGALAYGHPYGATGGILMSHLLTTLKQQNRPYGIATMGVAGGQGIAVLVRRYDDTVAKA